MLKGLNHITLAVSDLERSLAFYLDILGFQGHVRWDGGAYLSLGSLWLCLSIDEPCDKSDYSHIALDIEDKDFISFAMSVREKGVNEWKENRSEGNSLYLLDPDGHKLEIHAGSLQSRLDSLRKKPYLEQKWL
ncbi:fosfomycin resistance glutathione transferase [Grimontia sp. NTOU-MAR1]|uniref:fosfomycin resistance glutathione transferase n=1 Tax=Grimontia sp. NTOU-MAR1 TaxID=3111011 RepID=UPI002DBB9B29|nr:fosfomycin resistance glutathione transferase [Grimontia sp. NTOU-MAR1]WRW00812.1 fosfomycin resistance glutathione transferase [Grimontia sp. NTOU-MAR1]